jgi:hypothetical protein
MKSDKILVVIAATTLLTIAATTAATQILSVLQQEAAAQNTTMANQTIPPTENITNKSNTGRRSNRSCNSQPDTSRFRVSNR